MAPLILMPIPEHLTFPSAAAAVAYVMEAQPRVLGVGEIHATTGGPSGPTTLARFTTDIFPVLAPRATDLVLETWRLDGRCGATETAVATQVEADTKRPEVVKSDLEVLVEASVAGNVRPHDLVLTCTEYRSLLGKDAAVDYGALLRLLTVKLEDYAVRGVEASDAMVVLYGGAVHNDLYPRAELADYSYGVKAAKKGGAAYVELDLYQPELVRTNTTLLDPAWAPLLDEAGPDHVILVKRGPQSWILLMETAPAK